MTRTLILGCGYTGSRLLELLPGSVGVDLPSQAGPGVLPLDLSKAEDTAHLPECDSSILTFKLESRQQARQLKEHLHCRRLIILSSAGAFRVPEADAEIDESCPLQENERNAAEQLFEAEALILHLSLLYDDKLRQPSRWLQEGRIKNGRKYINLIHREDLCEIIRLLLGEDPFPTGRLLVSDGRPLRWSELAGKLNCPQPPLRETGIESKQVLNHRLLQVLPEEISFRKPVQEDLT